MPWEVEYSDEFGEQWADLSEDVQVAIDRLVQALEAVGPGLDYPYTSQIKGSRFGEMRELRVQHQGDPWRIFYAFDPRRVGYLIILGCKAGDDRFYETMVPRADKIFEQHLKELNVKK